MARGRTSERTEQTETGSVDQTATVETTADVAPVATSEPSKSVDELISALDAVGEKISGLTDLESIDLVIKRLHGMVSGAGELRQRIDAETRAERERQVREFAAKMGVDLSVLAAPSASRAKRSTKAAASGDGEKKRTGTPVQYRNPQTEAIVTWAGIGRKPGFVEAWKKEHDGDDSALRVQ